MKRIAFIGLGAVGAYFYWGIAGKQELEPIVIADGERAARLQETGITINQQQFWPKVRTAQEAAAEGGIDLILVSVKYGMIREILPVVKLLTSEQTLVLSLLNGVDSESILAEVIDKAHILYSFMKISSHRKGQTVTFDPVATEGLVYGEIESSEPTEKSKKIEELFAGTNVKATFVPNILQQQWWKFVLNCGGNLPQAVLGVGVGAYRDSKHVNFLSERLWEEARAVAAAKGIEIEPYPFKKKPRQIPNATRWSTLQDLDAKRHTEIDMFSGALIRMGEELGVPVPFHTYTYHAIKALEEKNDGKFDYTSLK